MSFSPGKSGSSSCSRITSQRSWSLLNINFLFLIITLSICIAHQAQASESPVVAAASSVNVALSEVAKVFAYRTYQNVRLSFGASGNITRQIIQGAPFQLFLSADEDYVRSLQRRGLTTGMGRVYAMGQLVFYVPHGSAILVDTGLQDLRKALDDGRLRRLAIANPEHAPYGRAAREALVHIGVWQRIKPKLVVGENIAQAAQFAASGSVDAGIIAYSVAVSSSIARRGEFVVIPDKWHKPLRHRMVLLRDAGPIARSFYAFIQSGTSLDIFRKYGFRAPIVSP